MLGKKDIQEVVVDLSFKETDLEQYVKYDTLNSDICFLKKQCKTKAHCKQLYQWLGLEMRFLVSLDAIALIRTISIAAYRSSRTCRRCGRRNSFCAGR